MQPSRIATALAGAGILTLATATFANAHDFWLIPNAFRLEVGEEGTVFGRTSSNFPTSLSAVTVDRVADARVISAKSEHSLTDLDVDGQSLRIRYRPEGPGQQVVALRIHPRDIPESAESFRRYLELEGAPEALAHYESEGMLPTDSIVRRYAKYAKTIVEVGSEGPRAFHRRVGHPLELVPLADPAGVQPGGALRFELLLEGEPLPNSPLHAGVANTMQDASSRTDARVETDRDGVVTVELDQAGIWNVRALVVVPAEQGAEADWMVHWATLVFSVDAG